MRGENSHHTGVLFSAIARSGLIAVTIKLRSLSLWHWVTKVTVITSPFFPFTSSLKKGTPRGRERERKKKENVRNIPRCSRVSYYNAAALVKPSLRPGLVFPLPPRRIDKSAASNNNDDDNNKSDTEGRNIRGGISRPLPSSTFTPDTGYRSKWYVYWPRVFFVEY